MQYPVGIQVEGSAKEEKVGQRDAVAEFHML